MDFALLNSEVEKRLAIWDPRDPKHCNRDWINKYWSEIAKIMNLVDILAHQDHNIAPAEMKRDLSVLLLAAEVCVRLRQRKFKFNENVKGSFQSISECIKFLCEELSIPDEKYKKLAERFDQLYDIFIKDLRCESLKQKLEKKYAIFIKDTKVFIEVILKKIGPSFLDEIAQLTGNLTETIQLNCSELSKLSDIQLQKPSLKPVKRRRMEEKSAVPAKRPKRKLFSRNTNILDSINDAMAGNSTVIAFAASNMGNTFQGDSRNAFDNDYDADASNQGSDGERDKQGTLNSASSAYSGTKNSAEMVPKNALSNVSEAEDNIQLSPRDADSNVSDSQSSERDSINQERQRELAVVASEADSGEQREPRSANITRISRSFRIVSEEEFHIARHSQVSNEYKNERSRYLSRESEAERNIQRPLAGANGNDSYSNASERESINQERLRGVAGVDSEGDNVAQRRPTSARVSSRRFVSSSLVSDEEVLVERDLQSSHENENEASRMPSNNRMRNSTIRARRLSRLPGNENERTLGRRGENRRDENGREENVESNDVSSSQDTYSNERTSTPREVNHPRNLRGILNHFSTSPNENNNSSTDSILQDGGITSTLPKKKNHKRRRPFSAEEEGYLVAGVRRFGVGRWREILDAYAFNGRTSVNLKDKWRNIASAHNA